MSKGLPCALAWLAISVGSAVAETTPEQLDVLMRGAKSGEVRLLQQVLPGADPDARNADGRTALMVAAMNGHFEAARFLLWQGADAALKDKDGHPAVHHLKAGDAGFAPLNLLLRCYAFIGTEAKPAGPPKHPHMVLVNDDLIDYDHKQLRDRYVVNADERDGKAGEDDDGNGFVDDAFGWNVTEDEPLRLPFFSLIRAGENRDFIVKLLADHEIAQGEIMRTGDPDADHAMRHSYNNPIIRDFGFSPLREVDIDLDDYRFAEMIHAASHGTHVAGIALETSGGKALLHGMTHAPRATPDLGDWDDIPWATRVASGSESYADFVKAIRQRILEEGTAQGKRSAAFIRASGAGVVNMSYSRPRGIFRRVAASLQDLYRESGKNPDSIADYKCPHGIDLCTDLALELAVADAAEFALSMANNPDVLFVLAAGNEGQNNDVELPSPCYLSRFFPNAITVASVNDSNRLSEFSNYGRRSVQIAAPGEQIEATVVGDARARMSGTSMAAPAVAGVAARLRAEYPKLSAAEVRRVLEISVKEVAGLEDKTHTGGVLDAEAALAVAADWKAGAQPLSSAELARLGPAGSDGPRIRVKEKRPHGRSAAGVVLSDPELTADSWRITAQGGYQNSWAVVMSRGTRMPRQALIVPGDGAWEHMRSFWDKRFEITSLVGDGNGWGMVMTKPQEEARLQHLVQYDQTEMRSLMSKGLRITAASGWKDDWRFVFTADTGWGRQRYTLPTDFDQHRKEWIQERWEEGYRITHVAGDEIGGDEGGSWVVVVAKGTELEEQAYNGVGPWPADWIKEKWDEGYFITSVAGFEENWLVVMSTGVGFTQQRWFHGPEYPRAEIEKAWKGEGE